MRNLSKTEYYTFEFLLFLTRYRGKNDAQWAGRGVLPYRPPALPTVGARLHVQPANLPPFGGDWGLQSSHRRGCGPTKGSESPFATEGKAGGWLHKGVYIQNGKKFVVK